MRKYIKHIKQPKINKKMFIFLKKKNNNINININNIYIESKPYEADENCLKLEPEPFRCEFWGTLWSVLITAGQHFLNKQINKERH